MTEWSKTDAQTRDVVAEIAGERYRQKSAEGWTPEHDDEHDEGQLADAAACYAAGAIPFAPMSPKSSRYVQLWPWAAEWWKPKDRRRDLIRAAALIVAEIERLDRAAADKVARWGRNAGAIWTCPSCGWRQDADRPRICGRAGEPCNGDRSWDRSGRAALEQGS